MQNNQPEPGAFNIAHLQDTALNVVENFCSVICRPVEMIIRPWHGSRYFPVPVIFFSSVMMAVLPIFSAIKDGVAAMIPFAHPRRPMGMFDIGSMARLYFLLCLVHGVRIYRRMIHPETEDHSEFEGPPLPFFLMIPRAKSFWFTRIVLEPAAIFIAAIVLENMFIIQPGLAVFLKFSAFALVMKAFVGWYRSWEFLRNMLDMRFVTPIIAKLADNKASDDELASVHLASFPKNISTDDRKTVASYIARAMSPDMHAEVPQETTN
jgi:hypothetical protein